MKGLPAFRLYPEEPILEASLIRRKNRFVVTCLLEGKLLDVHLPNPGRLWEILYPETTLYLISSKKGKLPYRIIGAETPRGPVMLDTVRANGVGEFLLRHRRIPGLQEWCLEAREVSFGKSRFDFLLRRGSERLLLELKSCTLFYGKGAMFPDAPTERGCRHVEELRSLSREPDLRGGVLFLIQTSECRVFLPDYHTDPAFAEALLAGRRDLWIGAQGMEWNRDFSLRALSDPPSLPWNVLEKENADRGCYLILYRLPEPRHILTGSLGNLLYPGGYYLYAGSAKKGLSSRVNRHLRKRKKLHWHADYFGQYAKALRGIPLRTSDSCEEILAEELSGLADWEVPGFGASDSSRSSHLFGFSRNPLDIPDFVTLLLRHRMEKMLCPHAADTPQDREKKTLPE